MINFITGLPGASKTLNTLRMVDQDCEGRTIYYYGIANCSMPGWTELTLEELHNWHELPSGSVIVVDEAHEIWPSIPNTRPSPDSVKRMAKHRHQGMDFYIITQRPAMVDANLRGFAGPHFHYERMFGRNGAKEIRFEQALTDTKDRTARSTAQIQWRPFNKKYYDYYKSAEVHTYKPKIPKSVYVIIGGLLVVGVLAVNLLGDWGFFGGQSDKEKIVMGEHAVSEPQLYDTLPPEFTAGATSEVMSTEQYAAQFTPRIPDLPWSAPAYDTVTEVKTYPRPQCIHRINKGICKCYTQQATPLDISQEMCLSIVNNGWFNPYIAEDAAVEAGAGAAQRPATATGGTVEEVNSASITVIPDSTNYKRGGGGREDST